MVCHEIEHVILNHPAEMVKANPDKDDQIFYEFNLAADASVNDRLKHEIKTEKHHFMSPPDGIIFPETLAGMYHLKYVRNLENYAYYFAFIKDERNNNSQSQNASNGQESIMEKRNQKDGNSPDQDSSDSSSAGAEPESNEAEDNRIVTAKNCKGQLTDHDWQAGEDPEDAAAAVRELVNASVSMMNDETRGMMPGYFEEICRYHYGW